MLVADPTMAATVNNLYSEQSDSVTFLRNLSNMFPELLLYETTSCFSPDVSGAMNQPNTALVAAVFTINKVQEWFDEDPDEHKKTAWAKIREINKVFLRLIYLRSFIQKDKSLFPFVSEDRFEKLSELIQLLCLDQDLLCFTTLSIIFDALGRTTTIRNLVNFVDESTENSNIDHEKYWRKFLQHFHGFVAPEYKGLFEHYLKSFNVLSHEGKDLYKNQVMTNSFNLSAFVQGESIPYSFYELAYSSGDYRHRIIVLLLTFISFQYNNEFEAVGYKNPTHDQFCTAASSILKAPVEVDISQLKVHCCNVYKEYLKERAVISGVPNEIIANYTPRECYTLFRIFSLSRSSNQKDWEKIFYIWDYLISKLMKEKLIDSMTRTGFEAKKAIYIYYAPALIANTITVAKGIAEFSLEQNDIEDFDRDGWTIGLFYALYQLVGIYEDVTKNELVQEVASVHGAGIHLYNATIDAKSILEEENTKYHQKVMKQLMFVKNQDEDI